MHEPGPIIIANHATPILPDRSHCQTAVSWRAGQTTGYVNPFYHTLWLLLSAGFCLLFLCNTCPAEEPPSDYYVVMFTAKWCGPCRAYKSSGHLERLQSRVPVTIVDIDDCPEWREYVPRVPAFWLARRSDRRRLKSWQGATHVETVEAEIQRLSGRK